LNEHHASAWWRNTTFVRYHWCQSAILLKKNRRKIGLTVTASITKDGSSLELIKLSE